MKSRDATQGISLILTVAIFLCGTGMTQAASVRTCPLAGTAELPFTPLADIDLERIEGGVINWIAVGAIATCIIAGCAVIGLIHKLTTDEVGSPYDAAGSSSCPQCYEVHQSMVVKKTAEGYEECPLIATDPETDDVIVGGPDEDECD